MAACYFRHADAESALQSFQTFGNVMSGYLPCDEPAIVKPVGVIEQRFNLWNAILFTELVNVGMILQLNILNHAINNYFFFIQKEQGFV